MLNKPDTSMENLLARTSNLTVLDEEGWEINPNGGSEVASFCAMGRFCSNRPLNRPLLKTILGRVWGVSDRDWGVEIKLSTKESSFLLFSFKSSQDLNRILSKNPWFLNNGFLIVERFDGIPHDWNKVLTRFPIKKGPPNLSSLGQIQRMGADLFSLSSSSNLGTTDKGKEVFLGDTFGLTASGNLLSQGTLNSGGGSMKEVIGEGISKAKKEWFLER
ncbi:hypothetical protein F8388_003426 [Cannabis sativa]|uniref:DUF4283 domain-containing protein n=1 Tax=Cannabis sativa TaxID=3483 RepID=A0A7J6F4W0_CANSA|nr:hypothetical protein F8388_003426 [Cannabis sativa]